MTNSKLLKLRWSAAALSTLASLVVFVVGAMWTRSVHDDLNLSRIDDSGRVLLARLKTKQDLVLGRLKLLAARDQAVTKVPGDEFDLFLHFDPQRKFSGGQFRKQGREEPSSSINVTNAMALRWLASDSHFFDQTAKGQAATGVLVFEGVPYLTAVIRVKDKGLDSFLVAGESLTADDFSQDGAVHHGYELFLPDNTAEEPRDVREARLAMQSDQRSSGRIERRGAGVGYVMIDDVFERPAVMVRYPWVDTGVTYERSTLLWLFLVAAAIGIVLYGSTTVALGWIAREKRRSPGLSGMSDEELRETVESFPGYVFALDDRGLYIGVSRALAGVTGKESVQFVGRLFGSLCGEAGLSPQDILKEMQSDQHWPMLRNVELTVHGLSEAFTFDGVVHYFVTKRTLMFVLTMRVQELAERHQKATHVPTSSERAA